MGKRITKSESDKILAGVCGGFAEHFGWDPTIVRILYTILILTSVGTMLLIYFVLMLIMPKPDVAK